MKLGCHGVLFTDRIAKETEAVLKGLEKTGCEGVEIGARFFGVHKNAYLKRLLENHHLRLSGLHVAVLWTQLLDEPQKVEAQIEAAIEFLQVMQDKNIIFSGMVCEDMAQWPQEPLDPRLSDPEAVERMAGKLNQLAIRAKERNVSLKYHNHCWEFASDGLLFRAILDHAPQVGFALDTGWVWVGGWDPIELLRSYPHRISYVHLRDYKKEVMKGLHTFAEKQEGFVDFGTGDMDTKGLLLGLGDHLGEEGWAVIEYEKGRVDYKRYELALAHARKILNR